MNNEQKGWKDKFSVGFFLLNSIAVVFAIAAVFLVNYVRIVEKKQALQDAEEKAKIILDRNMAIHAYFNKVMKPKIFEFTAPYLTPEYFEPSWMSSTYAVREIEKEFKLLGDINYSYKECAINARSPENETDDFEKAFVEELNNDPQLEFRSAVRKLDGQYFLVTLRRGEVMEDACLRCHSISAKAPKGLVDEYGPERSFNRKLGEVIDAISIRVPLSTAYARADQMTRNLSTVLLVTFIFLFLSQFLIYKFLIGRPLKRLFKQTSLIYESDNHLGEEIPLPATREFNKLSSTFNLMSKRLRKQIDNLEETVGKRTAELLTTNELLQKEIIKKKQTEEALQDANKKLIGLAMQDGLTKIANRRSFDVKLGEESRRMMRRKASLALIIFDVDHFKLYNDTYGHQAGDICLQMIADMATQLLKRPGDLLARYGGEEFAAILPDTGIEDAGTLAETICRRMQELEIRHESSPISDFVTVSCGVSSVIPDESISAQVLIEVADKALYRAKEQGRNRVVTRVYS